MGIPASASFHRARKSLQAARVRTRAAASASRFEAGSCKSGSDGGSRPAFAMANDRVALSLGRVLNQRFPRDYKHCHLLVLAIHPAARMGADNLFSFFRPRRTDWTLTRHSFFLPEPSHSQPHLNRIQPGIKVPQSCIRNMQVPHIHAPVIFFTQNMRAQSRAGREVYRVRIA